MGNSNTYLEIQDIYVTPEDNNNNNNENPFLLFMDWVNKMVGDREFHFQTFYHRDYSLHCRRDFVDIDSDDFPRLVHHHHQTPEVVLML